MGIAVQAGKSIGYSWLRPGHTLHSLANTAKDMRGPMPRLHVKQAIRWASPLSIAPLCTSE